MIGVVVRAKRWMWDMSGREGTSDRENGRRDEKGVAWGKGASVNMAPPCMSLRVGVGVSVGCMYGGVGALSVEVRL